MDPPHGRAGAPFASHGWAHAEPAEWTRCAVPRAAQLLRLLCLCLLLGRAAAPHPGTRRLQDEEVPEIDFEYGPTDRFRVGTWEIVTGYFYIKGPFLLSSVGDVAFAAKELLAGVCDTNLPTNVIARQDILTLNQPQVGLNMTFHILAPEGYAHYCVATLRFAAYGPSVGPFGQFTPPPIRSLARDALTQNTNLDLDAMDYWAIEIGNVACREALVSHGLEDSPPRLLERSTMPDRWEGRDEPSPCGEAEQVAWTPSSAVKYPWEEKPCLAAPTPCICASIRTCRYLPHPSGGKRCAQGWDTEGDFTRVDCEDCPYQADCPPTCKDAYTPCMCVFWNCTWDPGLSACGSQVPTAAPLSCLLCARQPHCLGLDVLGVEPRSWSLLGEEEVGWYINVTFNRQIIFGPLMQSTEQAVHMSCQSEAEAGMVPPVFVRFDLRAADLLLDQDTLFVDTRKVPNPLRMRFCELKILEGAIVDTSWVPMADSWTSHMFLLGDTVAPTLLTWAPENSARDIPLDVSVEMQFSEEVLIVPSNGSISLASLGSYGREGPADELIATFDVRSPRLILEDSSLRLMLGGLLRHDVLYSIGVDQDLVEDKVGNPFAGLPLGIYAFRTAPEPFVVPRSGPASAPTALTLTAVAAVVLLCLVVAVVVLAWWKSRGDKNAGKVAPETEGDGQEVPHWSEEVLDERAEFDNRRASPEASSPNGVNSFVGVLEDLRTVHMCTSEKAKQEELQAVTFQPQPDDSYYATFGTDDAAEDETILEPDMTIIHKVRPMSASNQRPGGDDKGVGSTSPLEVYEYYAFPPPWSADELARPPSRPHAPLSEPEMLELAALEDGTVNQQLQALAICGDPEIFRVDSNQTSARSVLSSPQRPKKSPKKRPVSAHESSKEIIKSLHDSLRSAKPKPRPRRPQSAPSQRVQERLMQSGAIVFREGDKRLPSQSALLDERRSRPVSAAQSRPQSAAHRLAIADTQLAMEARDQLERQLRLAQSRQSTRPSSATSAGRPSRSGGPPPDLAPAMAVPDMVLERTADGRDRLRLLGLEEEMPALRIIRDHSPSLKSPLSADERSAEEACLAHVEGADSEAMAPSEPRSEAADTQDPGRSEAPEAGSQSPEVSEDSSESQDDLDWKRGIGKPWAWQEGAYHKHQEQLFKDPNTERIFQQPKSRAPSQGRPESPVARRHRALGIRSRTSLLTSTREPETSPADRGED